MKTEQALREFFASRISMNLTPSTVSWYEDRLLALAKSCPTLPRRPEPIEAFLATLTGSPETKYDVFRALKTFFKFICKRRRLPNPMDAVEPMRRPRTHMPTLELNELTAVLCRLELLRDRAIISLMIDNGVRADEVCSLLKHNIKQETALVNGKTGWREVPISQETRRLLFQIAAFSTDDYVFHGQKGPITRHLVYAIVRRALERAGIKAPKLGPHRIRHAFAKNFLIQGGDLRSLQQILGHADIKTTEKYVTLNLTDIIKKHQQFSPLRAAQAGLQGNLFDTSAALKQAEAILKNTKEVSNGGEEGEHTE